MPLYQYQHQKTGRIVEQVRAVADRDDCPEGYARITVPARVAIHGTTSSPLDPDTALARVPKGLKSLPNNEVNSIVKESGFTVDKFKEVWAM